MAAAVATAATTITLLTMLKYICNDKKVLNTKRKKREIFKLQYYQKLDFLLFDTVTGKIFSLLFSSEDSRIYDRWLDKWIGSRISGYR